MANLTKGTDPRVPLFFNVDQRVGEGCANLAEDVALVSYLMRLAVKSTENPQARQILLATTVTTTCTPALVQSIKALQAAIKTNPDGRVSPSSPSGRYSGGKYLIVNLSVNVRRGYPDLWPRIDRMPDAPTPAAVIALVQRAMLGAG